MTHAGGLLQSGVDLLAVLGTGYFAVTMWRRRAEPTARPLLAVAVVLFVGAVGHVAVVHPTPVGRALEALAPPDAGGPVWIGVLFLVVSLSGGFWFLFALRYTGRGGRLVPLSGAAIGGLWLLVIGGALLGDATPSPEVQAGTRLEAALFVGTFLMAVVTLVGALLVLTTSLQRNALRVREALALGGGASLLAFSPTAADTLLHPSTAPVTFSVASGLFVLGVRRYPVFEAPPVARIAGRDRLIEELDDAFVVVDLDGRVRDLNPAAEQEFDTAEESVLGEPLDALLPVELDPAAVASGAEPVQLRTPAGATLAVTADRVTDARDRSFGHLLVFRDVTERQRRERRLGVLNRLLTGAVDDRMRAVAEDVAPLSAADGGADPDPSAVGRAVRTEASGLLDLVAWTRELERGLAAESAGPVDVLTVVREVVDEVAPDGAVAVTTDTDSVRAAVDPALLETVVEILLADALEHGTHPVGIEVVETDRGPGLHVVSEGTGPVDADAGAAASGGTTDTGGTRSRNDLLFEMVRLAVRHVGGDLSTPGDDAGEGRTVLALPGVDGTAPDERGPVLAGGGTAGSTDARREVDGA